MIILYLPVSDISLSKEDTWSPGFENTASVNVCTDDYYDYYAFSYYPSAVLMGRNSCILQFPMCGQVAEV